MWAQKENLLPDTGKAENISYECAVKTACK